MFQGFMFQGFIPLVAPRLVTHRLVTFLLASTPIELNPPIPSPVYTPTLSGFSAHRYPPSIVSM